MKEKIIGVLLDNGGNFISGEELSRQLNISRTAVWKHIKEIRGEGYVIEAFPRKGYRMKKKPDLLLPREIKRHLNTLRLGKSIEYLARVDSTNRRAKEMGLQGALEGTLVVAEEQTRGRGRLDRQWFSPRGGIWFSILLRPDLSPQQAPLLTLLTSLAGVKGIKNATGYSLYIKWPNDLFWQGKKAAGILTEINAEMDRINFVVVGVGINVNIRHDHFPEDISSEAISLMEEGGESVSRPKLLATFLNEMEKMYDQAQLEGFKELIGEWKKYSTTLGKRVEVKTPRGIIKGKAVDINEEGALMVEKEGGGVIHLLSGDVYLS